MLGPQVLLVAGTHGNEINGPWLFEQWSRKPNLINTHGLNFHRVIGNPAAYKIGKRYIDRDLNRSFQEHLLIDDYPSDSEILRARELIDLYGPNGLNPSNIAIDIHSTTSSMGSSLVVYERRASDLALASLIQARLGLPIYLHEGDQTQKGFLVERWPCGLVVEIGPVSQMVVSSTIVSQIRLILEAFFKSLQEVETKTVSFPDRLIVHRHLRSLDLPKDSKGFPVACLHPDIQGKDWQPIHCGSPLFLDFDGSLFRFEEEDPLVPVFINEAAYSEKNICMSLTKREIWPMHKDWESALEKIVCS